MGHSLKQLFKALASSNIYLAKKMLFFITLLLASPCFSAYLPNVSVLNKALVEGKYDSKEMRTRHLGASHLIVSVNTAANTVTYKYGPVDKVGDKAVDIIAISRKYKCG